MGQLGFQTLLLTASFYLSLIIYYALIFLIIGDILEFTIILGALAHTAAS